MLREFNPEIENLDPLMRFIHETKFLKINYDFVKSKYRDLVNSGILKVWLLCDGDKIYGGLAATKYQDWHSGEWFATELFWYVLPEYRSGFGALDLLRVYEKWARENGCSQMALIHLADSMPDRLERLYRNMGFELVEKVYRKELS